MTYHVLIIVLHERFRARIIFHLLLGRYLAGIKGTLEGSRFMLQEVLFRRIELDTNILCKIPSPISHAMQCHRGRSTHLSDDEKSLA